MMQRKIIRKTLLCAGLALLPSSLYAQRSDCADCHFAHPEAPAPYHLTDWDKSGHGRNDVGCEKCHGGDPSTFESFLAHRGILHSSNPASPTHRTNLPETCGACHMGPLVAFKKSHHYELLKEGNEAAPSCSTCHGSVAANLLSPKRLAHECERCHGEGKSAYRVEHPILGKVLLERVGEVRKLLDQTKHLIGRVKDDTRQRNLEEAYLLAEAPLKEAVDSGHSFVFDELQDCLNIARRRAEVLLDGIANSEKSQ
jgi:hypothetical protein